MGLGLGLVTRFKVRARFAIVLASLETRFGLASLALSLRSNWLEASYWLKAGVSALFCTDSKVYFLGSVDSRNYFSPAS